MRIFKIIVTLWLAVLVAAPSYAASPDYSNGVKAFNAKDYPRAISLLSRAVKGAEASNANAHYYLASAYMQKRRIGEALKEYQACLDLNPSGQVKAYCEKMLNHYKHGSTKAAAPSGSSAGTAKASASKKSKVDRSGLPKVKEYKDAMKGKPGLDKIKEWTVEGRVAYWNQSLDQFKAANAELQRAKKDRKAAEALIKIKVPKSRSFGETDAQFKAKVTKAQNARKELLKPYDEQVEKLQKIKDEAADIFRMCEKDYSRATMGVQRNFVPEGMEPKK